jgi:hypothetical protein
MRKQISVCCVYTEEKGLNLQNTTQNTRRRTYNTMAQDKGQKDKQLSTKHYTEH